MRLLSVNVSLPRTIGQGKKAVTTGIFKEPVTGRRWVRARNVEGDAQADLENHGGKFKAVYAYPFEHYAEWAKALDRDDFSYGQFGENCTVEGLLEEGVRIGDRFRIGTALVEVTQPRVPCFKLAMKMSLEDFPKRFLASGHTGFYLRVIEEGTIAAGDAILCVKSAPESLAVREVNRLMFQAKADLEGAKRALKIEALSPGWRMAFEKRLVEAGAPISSLPAWNREEAAAAGL